jgi:hypothetical protein
MQKERYEADSEMEGTLERVYLELEALPAMSISSNDDTDSTEKLGGKYDSALDPDVGMRMADDVDAPDGIDINGVVYMERDGDDDEEEDEEEEDEKKEEVEE